MKVRFLIYLILYHGINEEHKKDSDSNSVKESLKDLDKKITENIENNIQLSYNYDIINHLPLSLDIIIDECIDLDRTKPRNQHARPRLHQAKRRHSTKDLLRGRS